MIRAPRPRLHALALYLAAALAAAAALALPAVGWVVTGDPGPVAGQADPPRVRDADLRRLIAATPADVVRATAGVPVLTYHGIDDRPTPFAVSPRRFAEQMAALDRAGFHPISGAQFTAFTAGRPVRLPPKPILITFDDAIKSAWVHAEPILAQHGFRATLFVITGQVGRHQPYYMTWQEIARLKATGRWDFESHTRDGHRRVRITPQGDTGAFLTHRAWLAGAQRLETRPEYKRRIAADFDGSARDLEDHGLAAPSVFAFPFSTSVFPTNDPQVPALLNQAVFARFGTALDNRRRAALIPAAAGKRYLPRFEILRTTTTRAMLDGLATAAVLPREPPASGMESVYPFVSEGDQEAADAALEDRYVMPRYAATPIPRITWREDPFKEQYWRFAFYGLRPVADLVYAYRVSGDRRYRAKALSILRSFVAADDARRDRRRGGLDRRTWDYKYGAAFRALVLMDVRAKLRRTGGLPRDLDAGMVRAIGRLGAFLAEERNFDRGNNHGFAETTALLLASELYPRAPGARRWGRLAGARLVTLIDDNVDRSGVQVERSPFYHFYVLRLASNLTVWAQRYGVRLPRRFEQRTAEMLRFATWVTQPNGLIPLQGSSVRTNVRLLEPAVFAALGADDPAFEWVRTGALAGRPPRERVAAFPASGDVFLRSDWGTANDAAAPTAVAFNAGRWRTTHAHHDALTVVVSAQGHDVLPDSGLFTYDRGRWSEYFASTRAHNTLTIDGRDQDRGPVRMGLTAEGPGWSYASGLHRLYAGTLVRRSVIVLGRGRVLVLDTVDAVRSRRVVQNWHLFDGASLARRGRGTDVLASRRGRAQLAVWQAPVAGLELSDRFGRTDPPQGWSSAVYGKKQANHALEYAATGRNVLMGTLLVAGAGAAEPRGSVRIARPGPGLLRARACLGRRSWTVSVRHQAAAGERVAVVPGGRC